MSIEQHKTRDQRRRAPGRSFSSRFRTPRTHAEEGVEDNYNLPGLALLGLALIATALSLLAAAYGFSTRAIIAAVIAALLYLSGALWLAIEWRRRNTQGRSNNIDRQGH
ncbi:hypothetical protein [Nocardia sp. NBC_01327]|uniref:hypothetical protein n=1 Tax=Nocardia sp. NBC_01327 TaxID=2903593 RepID=UPI002E138514|nr:hypothetical protein OG326_18545 [Nocardia sp. NBC_01327]